jgi:hypothetical protein
MTSCHDNDESGTSQENPVWLNQWIEKAKTDRTSNYLGCIWREKSSKGEDIYVTNMMLGSGGILFWFFSKDGNHYALYPKENCSACQLVGTNHIFVDNIEDTQAPVEITKEVIVYSPENKDYICK